MTDFMLKTPFFRLFLALSAGIGVFVWLGWDMAIVIACLAASVLPVVIYLFSQKRYKHSSLLGISFLFAIFIFGYWLGYEHYRAIPLFGDDQKQGVFVVELTQYPIEKPRSVLIYADLLHSVDSNGLNPIKGKVALYVQKDSTILGFESGTRLMVSTLLSLPEPTGNPDEFDYKAHLLRKGICGVGYVAKEGWRQVGKNNNFSIMRLAQRTRMKMLDILKEKQIKGDEYAVIAALTLGYTDAVSPELNDSFSVTGASHVLSVSGLHVGVIFVMLGMILAFLDKSPTTTRLKWILIILFLWFYAFITGLSPSVCRSVFMFSTFALAKIINRKSHTYNNIFFSAFVLLIINPMWLFNVGFQLSYSALLAIIYFQPKIEDLLYFRHRPLRYAWSLTSVSLAAQLGAAPLCLYYFHQFPNYFLLSNFVGVPLSGIIIYLDLALVALHKIYILGDVVAFLLVSVTRIMNGGLQIIEGFYNVTSHIWIGSVQLLLIYTAIFALGFLFYKIKFRYLALMLTSIILFFSINIFNKISDAHYSELIVFKSNSAVVVNGISNGNNYILTDDTESAARMTVNLRLRRHLLPAEYVWVDTLSGINPFVFDKRRFVLMSSSKIYDSYAEQPLDIDYLIVTRGVKPTENLFKYYFDTKYLILTADVTPYNRRIFGTIAQKRNIECYSVARQGAFRLRATGAEYGY